jgi:hypothetical protein
MVTAGWGRGRVSDFLVHPGVIVRIDANSAIAHNRITVIASEVVRTGSFNFTKAVQEKNAETVLINRDPRRAVMRLACSCVASGGVDVNRGMRYATSVRLAGGLTADRVCRLTDGEARGFAAGDGRALKLRGHPSRARAFTCVWVRPGARPGCLYSRDTGGGAGVPGPLRPAGFGTLRSCDPTRVAPRIRPNPEMIAVARCRWGRQPATGARKRSFPRCSRPWPGRLHPSHTWPGLTLTPPEAFIRPQKRRFACGKSF